MLACDNVDDNHVPEPLPPKTMTSLRENLDTTCNIELPQSTSSYQEDMELSPRLTLYMEEGIVPESPVVEVSHLHLEIEGAVNVGLVRKHASPESFSVGGHTKLAGCKKGPLDFEKNGQWHSVVTVPGVSATQNVLDCTRAKTEEPMRPSNVKIGLEGMHQGRFSKLLSTEDYANTVTRSKESPPSLLMPVMMDLKNAIFLLELCQTK